MWAAYCARVRHLNEDDTPCACALTEWARIYGTGGRNPIVFPRKRRLNAASRKLLTEAESTFAKKYRELIRRLNAFDRGLQSEVSELIGYLRTGALISPQKRRLRLAEDQARSQK